MPNEFEFLNLVNGRRATITVIGLGNTGLPVAQGYAAQGFPVHGIDIDAARVAELSNGRSFLSHISDHDVKTLLDGSFSVGTDYCAVADADVVIVCVPTPLDAGGFADLSAVRAACDAMAPCLSRAALVMLQSTVPPGTTDVLAARLAAKSGLALGTDLFVAFAPERIDPANAAGWSIATTPRVVGGVTPACMRRASAVLETLCAKTTSVSNACSAEMTKLVENTFRMVNIMLANEISDVCRNLGVSEREVVEAASTKPFGFLAHRPGPGIGGDCIPVTPAFLLTNARQSGIPMPITATAYRQIAQRPQYVITRLTEALAQRRCLIETARVLVLGVSYKENVNDTRNAPALHIIQGLWQLGTTVYYHDPLVSALTVSGHRLESQPCDSPNLVRYDCAVLVTAHDEIVSQLDLTPLPLVLDTHHVLRQEGNVEWL